MDNKIKNKIEKMSNGEIMEIVNLCRRQIEINNSKVEMKKAKERAKKEKAEKAKKDQELIKAEKQRIENEKIAREKRIADLEFSQGGRIIFGRENL